MAPKMVLVCFAVLMVAIQTAFGDRIGNFNAPGCNVPTNLAPMNISRFIGDRQWYLLATANYNTPVWDTCIKMDFYVMRNGRRGLSEQTAITNNNTGNFKVDLYNTIFVRPGFFVFDGIKDPTLRIQDYIMYMDDNGYIATCCYVRNGRTFEQSWGYIGKTRTTPRDTILQAYRSAGITIINIHYLPQTDCRN